MISKEFKPHEIRGYIELDGKMVVYLKTGVKRQHRYQDHLNEDYPTHLNQQLIYLKRYAEYLKKVVGMDDFSDSASYN